MSERVGPSQFQKGKHDMQHATSRNWNDLKRNETGAAQIKFLLVAALIILLGFGAGQLISSLAKMVMP